MTYTGAYVSLKENIEMVKEELNQEEKLFESAVKTERFVKKYKMPLIGIVSTIFVILVGNSVYQASLASAQTASNEAYIELLKDPSDTKAAGILEDNNPSLFDAWKLQTALTNNDIEVLESLRSSSSPIVADLASYESAALKKDMAALNEYALNQEAVLKDLAILNEAVLLMQEGKTQEAQERLKMIDKKSSLQKIVTLLQHYGVK
ncbi:MAG: hypothetical protein COA44_02025 [Arcobacter sp.]|nr:MAG: hypothetical protein COA44_02025 [Arcobacter sp.]